LNCYHVYFELEDLTGEDIFNSIIKHGFSDEINSEVRIRGEIKEFEAEYCNLMDQRILKKLCFIFNVFENYNNLLVFVNLEEKI